MRLGNLIQRLGDFSASSNVFIEGAILTVPLGVASYRGYYEDLALGYSDATGDKTETVDGLRETLKQALGKVFEGYKGGNYTASEKTLVWVGNWGDASGCRVDGVYSHDEIVYLAVRMARFDRMP
jgi:hypothetical protein